MSIKIDNTWLWVNEIGVKRKEKKVSNNDIIVTHHNVFNALLPIRNQYKPIIILIITNQ